MDREQYLRYLSQTVDPVDFYQKISEGNNLNIGQGEFVDALTNPGNPNYVDIGWTGGRLKSSRTADNQLLQDYIKNNLNTVVTKLLGTNYTPPNHSASNYTGVTLGTGGSFIQQERPVFTSVEDSNTSNTNNTVSRSTSNSTSVPKPSGINLITSTLNIGSQGDQVKELQKYLQGLGYTNADGTPLKVDGIYGNNTKTAVMQFQSRNGLTADGIFGPKSLAKVKEITSTPVQEGTNSQQQRSTPSTASSVKTYNTGNPTQDALLNELQSFIKAQQDAGLKINEALNFDQATLDKFLETAKKQVHPFFQQQIDTIKEDVLRAAPQILQNYEADIAKQEEGFKGALDTSRENLAGAGLAFSGQRAKGELGMQTEQERNLKALSQGYGNKLYELGRGAEERIGSGNVNYNLGDLKNYKADLTGAGGFTLSGTNTPYRPGSYGVGSIQNDEAAAQEARRQALLRTASESVVAGRSYNDLFA